MEILHMVRARGQRWHVADVRSYESCRLLTLNASVPNLSTPDAKATQRRSCQLLAPFDEIVPVTTVSRPRRVSRQRWRRACRALIRTSTPPGSLLAASKAHLDVLAYQLQPALSILGGHATRLLLADEVGLGKTIQAGLAFTELIARGRADRVLILTPAGLRDQWAAELAMRFGLHPVVADAAGVRHLARTLPLDVNPWATIPIAIASIDYVKRPEVLPAVAACRWDVLVIDEAHAAVGDSERHQAARVLAARAAHVLLLTATPHSGDEHAYEALCHLGAASHDDRLLVFRRTRRDIHGGAGRRTRMLRVSTSIAERRMLEALASYHLAVRREHGSRALELSVLDKRAFSSAWSLAESVNRRLRQLEGSDQGIVGGHQLTLPLDTDGEISNDDAPPDWPTDLDLSDVALERRLLRDLSETARAASLRESKIAVLARLLRRSRESALIFTEYRDTAFHVSRRLEGVPVLHGGLAREERARLVEAFNDGTHPIVIATDAGGLGLNLQRRCRLVVNLELPWSPTRLEQRIGRVDRIGQRNRVHAVQLVGRETGEAVVLERLQRRSSTADRVLNSVADTTRLDDDAQKEAARLTAITRVGTRDDEAVLPALENSPWWIAKARRRLRLELRGRALRIYRMRTLTASGAGTLHLIAVMAPPQASDATVQAAIQVAVTDWLAAQTLLDTAYWRGRLQREEWIASDEHEGGTSVRQQGLFDHRIERLRAAARSGHDTALALGRQRLAAIREQAGILGHSLDLMLVLLP